MKHTYFQFFCILALTLNISTQAQAQAEVESEISDHFIDRAITACIDWINGGTLDYFESDWILSDETRDMRTAAEKFPELNRGESFFESQQHTFNAMIKKQAGTESCKIVENFLAVLLGPEEFDFARGKSILTSWGEVRAAEEGFSDWPDGATLGFKNRENTVFFKKKCSPSGLVIIDGMAAASPISYDGLRLPSWSVSIEYFDRQLAEGNQGLIDYIDLACPQVS